MNYLGYEENGAPGDVLRLCEGPVPPLSAGSVRIRLEAAPVHIADLKAIRGELPFVPPGRGVPGFEGVGRIEAVAPDVSEWATGDRVILPMAYGAWSDYLVLPADGLWRAPDDVPAEQLAFARINLSTAWLLLHAYATLAPGDVIVQNAANSNVAGYVASIAARAGIELVDVVRRPELVAALHAAGRRYVLLDGPDLAARIAALGLPRPRLAFDAIGGAATARLGAIVRDGGVVLAYGFLAEQPYALDYPDVMFRDVRLQGMMTDRAMAAIGAEGCATMRRELEALMAGDVLHAEIAGVYAFDDALAALDHAARTGSARAGKIVLTPR